MHLLRGKLTIIRSQQMAIQSSTVQLDIGATICPVVFPISSFTLSFSKEKRLRRQGELK